MKIVVGGLTASTLTCFGAMAGVGKSKLNDFWYAPAGFDRGNLNAGHMLVKFRDDDTYYKVKKPPQSVKR